MSQSLVFQSVVLSLLSDIHIGCLCRIVGNNRMLLFCDAWFFFINCFSCVVCMFCCQRQNEAHKKALTGGPFRLNMASRTYFDENPYKSEKALPPAKKTAEKKWDVKPFKPSSPSKMVSCCHVTFLLCINSYIQR